MAAQNIHHVRHLIGTDLLAQVDHIIETLEERTDRITAYVDNELLRGIPARGGVITDSMIPGSDDHVDQMDNIRQTL